jgi:transposase
MMRRQLNSTVHRRMNALLLLDDGWTAERVAEALFIDAETVREHRRLYASAGRAGIERLAYTGHAPVLTAEQSADLAAELSARVYLSAKAVCSFVAERFGLFYTPNAMAKLLGRMGFVWKRPKCIPAKADAEAQRAFLAETLAPLMAAAEADPAQPLYFVDATHPAYDAHPACGWIRRGETRMLKSNHGRVNVTMAGALSWPEREVVTREADRMTGPELVELLRDLAVRHPTATTISIVLDNASYNRAVTVREWLASEEGRRIRLVYLPPYAPNLNLIERFWWFFKKQALWNVYYPTFAEFKAGISAFFNGLDRWKAELNSLITNRFHFIGTERTQISTA